MPQLKVRVESYRNRYRLRYTLNKKTFTISTGLAGAINERSRESKANLQLCQSVATAIELDALSGNLKPVEHYKALFHPDRHIPEVRTGKAESLESVEPKKSKYKRKSEYQFSRKDHRLPITTEEFNELITAIRECRFDSKCSAYPSSFYADFIETAYLLGTRNQELIGLQVKHCNFGRGEIEISSVLARTGNCSHSKARVRKETKNSKIRYLPMSDRVREILENRCKGKQPDDLVFTSFRGLSIDDRALQRRVLKPYMRALGIGDRDLYSFRHSFQSRAIEQGFSIVQTSYLAGNTPETCMRNYLHIINKPKNLPEI